MNPLTEAQEPGAAPRATVLTLLEKRRRDEPITMLTAYDYPTASVLDEAGIDAILVGDSLAMVVLGHDDTLSVTMDEMLHHCRAVSRGARRALLIGDMPFMSYQAEPAEAVRNAGRFLKEGGMHAVKLEGGRAMATTIRSIVAVGIPVLGHVGLTPQSRHALGGFRVQGRTAAAARVLIDDAQALEAAGCFAIVIESVPARVAELVTRRLSIPTIGIGAGAGVSGQVLVLNDLLGLYDQLSPRFVKRYAELRGVMSDAVRAYKREVEERVFPGDGHTYAISDDEWNELARGSAEPPQRLASFGKRG